MLSNFKHCITKFRDMYVLHTLSSIKLYVLIDPLAFNEYISMLSLDFEYMRDIKCPKIGL